jgi:hypothetical protein
VIPFPAIVSRCTVRSPVQEDIVRLFKAIFASGGLLLATAMRATAAPLALLQDPQAPVKVDVHTTETHTVWYADPLWITVGAVVVLLIIVLAVMAARNKDSSTTTVIR